MVKSEGQRFVREYKKQDVGICIYGMPHQDGVMWEYENRSKNYVQEETCTFNLTNAWIEGFNGDTHKIILKPNQNKLVNIIFGSGNHTDAGNMDKILYKIKPLNEY